MNKRHEEQLLSFMRKRALYKAGLREEFDVQPRQFENWVDACIAEVDGLEVDMLIRSCQKRGAK